MFGGRPGRTKTTSFSLDDVTLRDLKALAARRHKGNVSALLAEVASREAKFAAAELFFTKYGVTPPSDEALEKLESEWRSEIPLSHPTKTWGPKRPRRRAV